MATINYTKTNWVNGTSPAINATNLNKIEGGIYDATTEVNKKYEKPSGGIPSSDMASAVQSSLGLANSAIQIIEKYTNPSPTSSKEDFDVQASLSDCSIVIVVFYSSTSEQKTHTVLGYKNQNNCIYADAGQANSDAVVRRRFTLYDTYIHFSKCTENGSETNYAKTRMIPYKVYGIKGVQG